MKLYLKKILVVLLLFLKKVYFEKDFSSRYFFFNLYISLDKFWKNKVIFH